MSRLFLDFLAEQWTVLNNCFSEAVLSPRYHRSTVQVNRAPVTVAHFGGFCLWNPSSVGTGLGGFLRSLLATH